MLEGPLRFSLPVVCKNVCMYVGGREGHVCVCVCVCMWGCVCIYVCVHACRGGWMDGWRFLIKNKTKNKQTNKKKNISLYKENTVTDFVKLGMWV